MKKIILASAIALISATAFASNDHGHGDDTVKDFTKHGHDKSVSMPMSKGATHGHGDDTVKDFTKHDESGMPSPTGKGSGKPAHGHGDDTVKDFTKHNES